MTMTNNLKTLLTQYEVNKIVIIKLSYYKQADELDGLFEFYKHGKQMVFDYKRAAIEAALLLALKDKIINQHVTGLDVSFVIPPGIEVTNASGLDITKAPGTDYVFKVDLLDDELEEDCDKTTGDHYY